MQYLDNLRIVPKIQERLVTLMKVDPIDLFVSVICQYSPPNGIVELIEKRRAKQLLKRATISDITVSIHMPSNSISNTETVD